MITDTEYIISQCKDTPSEIKDVRHRIAAHLKRTLRYKPADDEYSVTLKSDLTFTNNFLKQNPNILVLKVDKGNTKILMDSKEYRRSDLHHRNQK